MSKVLVVDDDTDILTVVEIILTMHNIVVKTISRGEDIPSSIQSFSPDLILLDVALGSTDGREVCKRLKQSIQTRNIAVILFSAHYDLVNNIHEFMADGLVTKPFETSNLLATIRKHIA